MSRSGAQVRGLSRRIWGLLKWLLIIAAVLFLIAAGALAVALYPHHPLPQYERVDEIVYLKSGLGSGTRRRRPADLLLYAARNVDKEYRYNWFTNLEQARNRKRYPDADNLREFGFLR